MSLYIFNPTILVYFSSNVNISWLRILLPPPEEEEGFVRKEKNSEPAFRFEKRMKAQKSQKRQLHVIFNMSSSMEYIVVTTL